LFKHAGMMAMDRARATKTSGFVFFMAFGLRELVSSERPEP
jgi:hypothetical protein